MNIWDNLSNKQRLVLVLGGIVVVTGLIFKIALYPFFQAREKIQKAVKANEKILEQIVPLAKEYAKLRLEAERITQPQGRSSEVSYLEGLMDQAGIKGNLEQISESRGITVFPYEEVPVEVRIGKLTLRQLVNFLALLEAPEKLIYIQRIHIARMKEYPEYLRVKLVLVTHRPLKGRGG